MNFFNRFTHHQSHKHLVTLSLFQTLFYLIGQSELIVLQRIKLELIRTFCLYQEFIKFYVCSSSKLDDLIRKPEATRHQFFFHLGNFVAWQCREYDRIQTSWRTLNNALIIKEIKNIINACINSRPLKKIVYVFFRRGDGCIVSNIIQRIKQQDSFEYCKVLCSFVFYLKTI